jgi:glycosyltransferase involved in cell wall biosynthesis
VTGDDPLAADRLAAMRAQYSAGGLDESELAPTWIDQLRRWLDDFAPELVFFQSSSATFAFDLVEDVCASRGIPLIVETTDDYVTPSRSWSPASRLYYRGMQRAYQRAVDRAVTVVAICQKMADEYQARFGGRYEVAMNSVPFTETTPPAPLTPDRPVVLHFAGNLGLNRWQVLSSVGLALDELSRQYGVEGRLEIYSIDAPEPAVLEALTASSRVRFCGSVDAETLRGHRAGSDILVHVESFDARNRHVTRLSVSTKIPEYLAADRTLLAVGPGDVASIEYVRDNEVGRVVTVDSPEAIAATLHELVSDDALRERLRRDGLALAHRNHSREATRQMITGLVRDAVG